MKSRNFYLRLTFIFVLALVAAFSLSSRALSANRAAGPESAQTNNRFSVRPVLGEQSGLLQNGLAYSSYTRITDNEEKISLEVPVEWSDIETGTWTYKNRSVGIYVAASSNLASFYANASVSGVFIGVSNELAHTHGKDGLLDMEKKDVSSQCLHKGRFDFQNNFYAGQYDDFMNCATGTPGLLVFTTEAADKKSIILVRIAVVNEADIEAVDKIINTFQVLGDPGVDDHHDH